MSLTIHKLSTVDGGTSIVHGGQLIPVTRKHDIINEYTSGAGVTIEGVTFKDGGLSVVLSSGFGGDRVIASTTNSDLTLSGDGTGDVVIGNTNVLEVNIIDPVPLTDDVVINNIIFGGSGRNVDFLTGILSVNNIGPSTVGGDLLIYNNVSVGPTGNVEGINQLASSTVTSIDFMCATIVCTSEVEVDDIVGGPSVLIDGVQLTSGGWTQSGALLVDMVYETIADAGVTIDGVLLKDGGMSCTGNMAVDTVSNVVIDASVICSSGDLTADVSVDVISERTAGNGVAVESVLCKDSNVTTGTLYVDAIENDEGTKIILNAALKVDNILSSGADIRIGDITIDGRNISGLRTMIGTLIDFEYSEFIDVTLADTIMEYTADTGVNVTGCTFKDGGLSTSIGDMVINTQTVTNDLNKRSGSGVNVDSAVFDVGVMKLNTIGVDDISHPSGGELDVSGVKFSGGDIYTTADTEWTNCNISSLFGFNGWVSYIQRVYRRVGNEVYCQARVTGLSPFTTGYTRFIFTLPIATANDTTPVYASNTQIYGSTHISKGYIQRIPGDTGNCLAMFNVKATSGTIYSISLNLIYALD